MDHLISLISAIGKNYSTEKIILFGSRARGDHKERSDIDLAVYGLSKEDQSLFWSNIEDLPTLLQFDLVFVDRDTDPNLLENIEKDGVVIYEKN